MKVEYKNNSPWCCRDNLLSNHQLDKVWNESLNNETKKSVSTEDDSVAANEVRKWKHARILQLFYNSLTIEEKYKVFNEQFRKNVGRDIPLEEFILLWNEN